MTAPFRFTQSKRPVRVECRTIPAAQFGPDPLLLMSFTGVEEISQPFRFELELFSESRIPANFVVRRILSLTFTQIDPERVINGLVSRFAFHGGTTQGLFRYSATLVPWFAFLGETFDNRIFNDMMAQDIIDRVLKKVPDGVFEIADVRTTRPKRARTVQYRESTLNFVSRLMEEEGMHYRFRHDRVAHVMEISDGKNGPKPATQVQQGVFTEGSTGAELGLGIFAVREEEAPIVEKFTLRDFFEEKPSANLTVEAKLEEAGTSVPAPPPALETREYFSHNYRTHDDGVFYGKIEVERAVVHRRVLHGKSRNPLFAAGFIIGVTDQLFGDDYLLERVEHSCRLTGADPFEGVSLDYVNTFVAIPRRSLDTFISYRPPKRTPKPVVRGSQTAIVIGPKEEEIHTDELGRVKIRFHWDHDDEQVQLNTSFVRVAMPWAGKNFGAVQIPRVGEEVVVDFLEGDPDRPIVTGRVYNGERKPPYDLPANKTQSGVKTRSAKQGAASNFNEIRFEDKKGSEELHIQAEKNLTERVKASHVTAVGGNRNIDVQGDHEEKIKGLLSVEVTEGNYHLEVKAGTGIVRVKDKMLEEFGNKATRSVKTKYTVIGGDEIFLECGDGTIKMTKDGTIEVKCKTFILNADDAVKIESQAINIEGKEAAKMSVGGQSVGVSTSATDMAGAQVNVQATGPLKLSGQVVQAEGKALFQLKGATTIVKGDGMLVTQGGTSMMS